MPRLNTENKPFKRSTMIGMRLRDPSSGTSGIVDAVTVQPDGAPLARINDMWFEVAGLVAV